MRKSDWVRSRAGRFGASRPGDRGRPRPNGAIEKEIAVPDDSTEMEHEGTAPMTFRFDMLEEVVDVDVESRTCTVRMIPDPRRYERVDEDDRHGWFDRFDYLFFPDA